MTTKYLNMSLLPDMSVPLSYQSSKSTLAKFAPGMEQVEQLTHLKDEDGNPLVVPGRPFAIWCTYVEAAEKPVVDNSTIKIMGTDGIIRTAAAPKEPDVVPFT